MKQNITKSLFISLLLTGLFGCDNNQSSTSESSAKLEGTCKALFEARMKEYDSDPEKTAYKITSREKLEKLVRDDYLRMSEEECIAEKNFSEDDI